MGRPRLEGEHKAPARHRHVSQPKVRTFVPRRGHMVAPTRKGEVLCCLGRLHALPRTQSARFCDSVVPYLAGRAQSANFCVGPGVLSRAGQLREIVPWWPAYPLLHRNSHFGCEADAALAGRTKIRTLSCPLVQDAAHALVYLFLEQDSAAQKFALWAARVARAPPVALVSCERTASAAQSNAGSCLLPHRLTDLGMFKCKQAFNSQQAFQQLKNRCGTIT